MIYLYLLYYFIKNLIKMIYIIIQNFIQFYHLCLFIIIFTQFHFYYLKNDKKSEQY